MRNTIKFSLKILIRTVYADIMMCCTGLARRYLTGCIRPEIRSCMFYRKILEESLKECSWRPVG